MRLKFLDKLSQTLEKKTEKGQPLHRFWALWDAIDTFAFTPKEVTTKGSHIRDTVDMKRVMITVIIALFPALLFGIWNIGYQHFLSIQTSVSFWGALWYGFLKWLPLVIVVYVSGLLVEIIFAQIRGHQVAEGFFVTGFILPLILPPDIPLWIVAIATMFAVLFGKEVFGGTGYNFLNPALIARAFIFFAYPSVISGDKVWIAEKADAFSGATPLSDIANNHLSALPSTMDMLVGTISGSIGETSKIAILLGAAVLLFTQVANWKIMLSVVAGGFLSALTFNILGGTPMAEVPAYQQLLMGGFLFGAVFMATDPVTAAHTQWGKVIYGFLIGVFAILIRDYNKGYPEGMMLAILLMNIFAPLIDYCVVQVNIKRRMKRVKIVK
ncbi:MAG: NADH:ubiquinone reductase (Na(+)-transporting) subunit B [Bacteroidales bacterium]|nr:NADH:ubiquinone reductase (Na(+)-transporting) subunit B [Bacteroidales bacterium]